MNVLQVIFVIKEPNIPILLLLQFNQLSALPDINVLKDLFNKLIVQLDTISQMQDSLHAFSVKLDTFVLLLLELH